MFLVPDWFIFGLPLYYLLLSRCKNPNMALFSFHKKNIPVLAFLIHPSYWDILYDASQVTVKNTYQNKLHLSLTVNMNLKFHLLIFD